MSDTIDSAVAPIQETAVEATSAESPPSPRWITARDLTRLLQGFYGVFWGLLISVMVGTQLVFGLEARLLTQLLLAGGVVMTLVGSWRLYQAETAGAVWRSRAGWLTVTAALMVYFTVFVLLWQRVPTSRYLLGNVLAFIGTWIVYVVQFNRAVSALGAAFGRRDMAIEARLFNASNVALLLVPFVSALIYIVTMSIAREHSLAFELQLVLRNSNLLLVILLLLPFSLTLSLAWGAKDAVLRRLAAFDLLVARTADRSGSEPQPPGS
jgi:hypothetical protein